MALVSNRENKGFTLIELLVVISIIGLLTSVVLANVSRVRAKTRDTSNIQALIQIKNAIELYKADHGSYPYFGTNNSTECNYLNYLPETTIVNYHGYSELIPGLVPAYIKSYPFSLSTKLPRAYAYCSDGKDYFFQGIYVLEAPIPSTSVFSLPLGLSFTVIQNVYYSPNSVTVYSNLNYLLNPNYTPPPAI